MNFSVLLSLWRPGGTLGLGPLGGGPLRGGDPGDGALGGGTLRMGPWGGGFVDKSKLWGKIENDFQSSSKRVKYTRVM